MFAPYKFLKAKTEFAEESSGMGQSFIMNCRMVHVVQLLRLAFPFSRDRLSLKAKTGYDHTTRN